MRIRYLTLMGLVAVLLAVAGCGGGDAGSETDDQRRAETQTATDSLPETDPESTGPAEITGSVTDRASAQVREDGLHLKVGRYKFDVASGVAPVGTTVEITTFQEEPSEIAAQGGNSRIAFERLSSKATLQGTSQEVARTEDPYSITLQNTGRGFTVDAPGGAQLEKPLQVTFLGDEYTSSLQNMGSNDTAPVLLREREDGLTWGAPALLSPDEKGFTATLAKVGTYYEAAFSSANDAGDAMTDVADQTFAKRTPEPACHGQPIEAPDGGTVSVETSSDAAWACLDREGDYVVVSLTNNYPSPLIVNSDPAAPFKLTSRESTQDALVRNFGESQGQIVLPVKGEAQLSYSIEDALPGTIELSTSYELANAQFFGAFLDIAAGPFDSVALKRLLNTKSGFECFESIYLKDYMGTTVDCGTLAAKEFGKLISLLFTAGEQINAFAGQVMEDFNGPYSVTVNHEPSSNDETGSHLRQSWSGEVTERVDGEVVPSLSGYRAEADIIPVSEMTEETVGEVVGKVSYGSLDCRGSWTLKEVKEDSVVVEEQIEEGAGSCVASGTVTLTPQENGTLKYRWGEKGYDHVATATLTQGSAADQQSSLEQTWAGPIPDNGGGAPYKAEASIVPIPEMTEDMVGEAVGEVEYDLGCSGSWTLKEANEDSIVVKERIEEGGGCVETGFITLTPQEDGSLKYRWVDEYDEENVDTGKLSLQGDD